jgi:ornithine carbamoyltransferase
MRKDFLSILDLSPAELAHLLQLAARLKRDRPLGRRAPTASALEGRHVALLFEKPSLRTRSTFEIAVHELGGDVLVVPPEAALGTREAIGDVARNLERWVDVAVVRTFAQTRLEAFAAAASRLHVINALTDQEHPCQALADLMTLRERWGELAGRTVAFVGDGNNVATSLAHAAALAGLHLRLASPPGFELPATVVEQARRHAREGATLYLTADPYDAVAGADAVYTDVWISMGQEAEAESRRRAFEPYQVNRPLMDRARPGALFLHCLPAHRGEEVTDEILDGPHSVVFDQAENRLHTEKALLLMVCGLA